MLLERDGSTSGQCESSRPTGWQKFSDIVITPFLCSVVISIGFAFFIEISRASGLESWAHLFGVVILAYILGYLMAPLVAYTAIEYMSVFSVSSIQYLGVLVLVVASFVIAARIRSRLLKVALRTACFALLPWSALMAMSSHA